MREAKPTTPHYPRAIGRRHPLLTVPPPLTVRRQRPGHNWGMRRLRRLAGILIGRLLLSLRLNRLNRLNRLPLVAVPPPAVII